MATPQCEHGDRTYKTGTGAKGPWAAWFCGTPKGTPDQCAPQWVKNDAPALTGASSEVVDLLTRIAVAVERMAGSN